VHPPREFADAPLLIEDGNHDRYQRIVGTGRGHEASHPTTPRPLAHGIAPMQSAAAAGIVRVAATGRLGAPKASDNLWVTSP